MPITKSISRLPAGLCANKCYTGDVFKLAPANPFLLARKHERQRSWEGLRACHDGIMEIYNTNVLPLHSRRLWAPGVGSRSCPSEVQEIAQMQQQRESLLILERKMWTTSQAWQHKSFSAQHGGAENSSESHLSRPEELEESRAAMTESLPASTSGRSPSIMSQAAAYIKAALAMLQKSWWRSVKAIVSVLGWVPWLAREMQLKRLRNELKKDPQPERSSSSAILFLLSNQCIQMSTSIRTR